MDLVYVISLSGLICSEKDRKQQRGAYEVLPSVEEES